MAAPGADGEGYRLVLERRRGVEGLATSGVGNGEAKDRGSTGTPTAGEGCRYRCGFGSRNGRKNGFLRHRVVREMKREMDMKTDRGP